VIANKLPTAPPSLQSVLVELGLVLFVVTVVVNSLARLLLWNTTRRRTSKSPFPTSALSALSLRNGEQAARLPRLPWKRLARLIPERRKMFNRCVNALMTGVLGLCLAITLVPLFHILGYITYRGIGSVNLAFFTNLPLDQPAGLGNALAGSALIVGLATLWAVPIGILGAIYLAEYRSSRWTPVIRFLGELLAGVPSVIIGLFVYALICRPSQDFPGWAGSFALGVMMIPSVMRASEESLRLVPGSLRNASYALGATHAQSVIRVIVPAALPAIITGVFLAIARIAGETAPLLLTVYNTNFWPRFPGGRTSFLTYYIYFGATSPDVEERRLAWAGALVLLLLVMALNVGIRIITGNRRLMASRAD
jgi:phosphate transport system permease protein